MPDHVAAHRAGGVAEESVRLCGHLVGDGDHCVIDLGEGQQLVHMLVQQALPFRQRTAAYELGPEVGGQGIHYQQADRVQLAYVRGLLHQQHLVRGVVSPGDMDALQYLFRVRPHAVGHLHYPLRTEGVLGVDYDHVTVQSALLLGQGGVHCQLEAYLGLAAAELSVELVYGLGLQSMAQQLVEGL
ncbi:MAG: hypothetical protein A4E30_01067 [Methanomassiliicoccales archaeon PtaB.Bin215]|nr:MAG: hypothetical protein A4E30_01067 [Methanomassiliicoccales archaeon PtaB.Bin215]